MSKKEVSGIDYWHNKAPKCPHCNYELEDAWDYGLDFDQDAENEITCPECDKDYKAITHIEVTFSTKNTWGELF